MEEPLEGEDKPSWVIVSPLEHFLSGHDTQDKAEVEACRLNQQARTQGRPPHYLATVRPHLGE